MACRVLMGRLLGLAVEVNREKSRLELFIYFIRGSLVAKNVCFEVLSRC